MLIQVRKTRRRGALLAATTCALLVASGSAVAAVTPGTGSDPAAQAWSVDLATLTADDTGVRHSDGALRLSSPADDGAAAPAEDGAATPAAEAPAPVPDAGAQATTPDAGTQATGPTEPTEPAAAPSATADQERSGQLVAPPVTLDEPAGSVTAEVDATTPHGTSVLVDVRARLTEQGPDAWTEWVPAGSTLPAASGTVQARVTLVGAQAVGPTVREVTLTPAAPRSRSLQDVEAESATTSAADVYRVFATREGLVGGTTANGHVITQRDHFVALPSRRGLSANSSGSYSVRVCAASTGRCAYAPVWDVGPWNTTDDYWNPASTRQSWTDLPQGRPQSQAAYEDGYNGGLDGFGRRVANPAGIDLGDGTFWDGLGLTDNAWTTVTYLWTGSGPRGIVRTSGGPLTVRSGPGTGTSAVGLAGNHANVVIECTATGTTVTGTYGTTNVWNRIGPGNWVSDAYVNTGSSAPVAPSC
ncbi:hypothetical protein ACIG47_21775 [Promicromonospora sp. NPDC052451]|uniref:hypothetical protein n=1 Tax=Promicromonospora sp. NPDC052451 TaxID=3364407 RepID=UPI0037CA3888